MKRGIFYVATGDKFVKEACVSALSIRSHIKEIHITAYFDVTPENHPFDEIVIIENPTHSFADKIPPFCAPPYEQNIFIDTDTICLEDFSELFSVLENHDLGVCHGVIRDCAPSLNTAPEWFPELNTGVVVFKKDQTREFFLSWQNKHNEYQKIKGDSFDDQPAFRHCLYNCDLKWVVLPREYNLRPVHGWLASACAKVKILHGRGYPMRKAARHVNRVTRKHRGPNLKTRVGELNIVDRIYWKLLCKLKLDIK